MAVNHLLRCPFRISSKRESLSTSHLPFRKFPKYWCESSEVQGLSWDVTAPSTTWQPRIRVEVTEGRALPSASHRDRSFPACRLGRQLECSVSGLAWSLSHSTSLLCSKTTGGECTESSRELRGLFSFTLTCQSISLTIEKDLIEFPKLYCECQCVESKATFLG